MARADFEAIKARADLGALALAAGVRLKARGATRSGLCPFHQEKTPSFTIRGHRFRCFGCGAAGTAIDFVARLEGIDAVAAAKRLAGELGLADAAPLDPAAKARADAERRSAREAAEREAALDQARRRATAQEIWRGARSGAPEIARYLAARLDMTGLAVPASLRFEPRCYDGGAKDFFPAMIAPVQDAAGHFLGIHRTFLAPGGAGKRDRRHGPAKMTLGAIGGGHVRLTGLTPRAVLGEGIETTLAFFGALTRAGRGAGWCAIAGLSLGNLCGEGFGATPDRGRAALVLPRGTAELILLEDNDMTDPRRREEAYARAAAKFARAGIAVRRVTPPAGFDFADLQGAA